jgi:hypothetical protein
MCRASSSGQCNLLRPKSMANLKWHSAAICLEAKEPVATAGLRLAREQSLTVRLLNLLTIANTPSTTTVLDSPFLLMLVTSSSYTTCLLPYRPAITFQPPHCCSSSDPSLWVRQPSPPYDCSPIAVLNLQQIHFAAFWGIAIATTLSCDSLLGLFEIKLRWPRRVHNC